LLKKLINFNVKNFIKIFYLKILYVSACVSPLFLIQNLFQDGLARFILLSAFAIIWFLIAMYLVGLDKKEKELIGVMPLMKLGVNYILKFNSRKGNALILF